MKSFTSLFVMLLLSVSLLSGCIIHIDGSGGRNMEHSSEHLILSADGLTRLSIEAGAGELHVVGIAGADHISVEATIWSEQGDDDGGRDYKLTLDERGGHAALIADAQGRAARIDLMIHLPGFLALDINDGSGDIIIQNINNSVKIEDASGSVEINHLGGDLTLDDASGGIYITHVDGDVAIEDGSGEIEITQVTGHVVIEDGSGDIEVSHVGRTVKIDDGSGDIDINQAGGLEIINAGSGDVSVRGVDSFHRRE